MRNYGRIAALLLVLAITLLFVLEWASRVGRLH